MHIWMHNTVVTLLKWCLHKEMCNLHVMISGLKYIIRDYYEWEAKKSGCRAN